MRISIESPRGCGHRSPGGLYLVADESSAPCGRFPIPLTTCPACSAGIKFARGFTWIEPEVLFADNQCSEHRETCARCPMSRAFDRESHGRTGEAASGRHGLLWIGDKYYSVEAFKLEARLRGICRRISTAPRDFKLGQTWVYLAHRKAIPCPSCHVEGDSFALVGADDECERCEGAGAVPGVFYAFRPLRVEFVSDGRDLEETLKRMRKRGVTPVRVARVDHGGQPLSDVDARLIRDKHRLDGVT